MFRMFTIYVLLLYCIIIFLCLYLICLCTIVILVYENKDIYTLGYRRKQQVLGKLDTSITVYQVQVTMGANRNCR
jgi:hypothetical protein